MSSANAGVFFYRTRIVAPVVVAPVVNAYTGWTYMVTRRVCN